MKHSVYFEQIKKLLPFHFFLLTIYLETLSLSLQMTLYKEPWLMQVSESTINYHHHFYYYCQGLHLLESQFRSVFSRSISKDLRFPDPPFPSLHNSLISRTILRICANPCRADVWIVSKKSGTPTILSLLH